MILRLIAALVLLSANAAAQATTGMEAALPPAALESGGRLSSAVEIAVLLTVLSLVPAILVTITSFTRIVIVLSFVRRAIGVNELPPNPVIIGLALFLTAFVMAPVAGRIQEKAWTPYRAGSASLEDASSAAWGEMRGFLVANTRSSEIALFAEMAKSPTTRPPTSTHFQVT